MKLRPGWSLRPCWSKRKPDRGVDIDVLARVPQILCKAWRCLLWQIEKCHLSTNRKVNFKKIKEMISFFSYFFLFFVVLYGLSDLNDLVIANCDSNLSAKDCDPYELKSLISTQNCIGKRVWSLMNLGLCSTWFIVEINLRTKLLC